MSFQHIPAKAISVTLNSQQPYQYMGFNVPANYPIFPGDTAPPPDPLAFRWTVELAVNNQQHSSIHTRAPGIYTGMDIEIGQWIANITTGQAYQIISIISKSDTDLTCVVQDIFRYNTFKDSGQSGVGGEPAAGSEYVVFEVLEDGLPTIDPKPENLVNPGFWINLSSRFNYINSQYDYPLFQRGNTFSVGDIVAVDSVTNKFVKASNVNNLTIGTVTSVSDILPNWFTINPVTKIDDFLDYLPGSIGSIIYTDKNNPGKLTDSSGGNPVYIKLRNNGQSITKSAANANAGAGTAFRINEVTVTVQSPGNMASIVSSLEAVSSQTGVNAAVGLVDNSLIINQSLIGPRNYLVTSGTPAKATINGVEVIFDIPQTWGSDLNQAGSDAMASAINASNIPNIVASSTLNNGLTLTNTAGGEITIVNTVNDSLGTPFAGPNSASGLALTKAASTSQCIVLTAVDARPINLLNIIASPLNSLGLISVENAPKACGLYIGTGLRTATNTVVVNLVARDALTPFVGDQAYVLNSDDGNNNYVNQWSTWIWDGSTWVLLARQSSASVDSKTLSYSVSAATAASFNIGKLTTGRRIVSTAINVTSAFNGTPVLELGYSINSTGTPSEPSTNGLMTADMSNLNATGIYTNDSGIKFGTDGTPGVSVNGDVTITGVFNLGSATVGAATIIITYV